MHFYPNVLKSGRIDHFVPKHRNEEERDELLEQLNENDPKVDRLKMLTEDRENLWTFRYYGDNDTYTEIKGENEN